MEVLHGKQPDPDRARRQRDSRPGDDRSLDWSERSNDLLLYPHSPLALADVLCHARGSFDLLPEAGEPELERTTAQPAPNATVPAIVQRKNRRSQRLRANLLTRHPEAELFERCKTTLTANALVSHTGHRRLYLVAGFVSWPDPQNTGKLCRSPLLFYPATLIQKTDTEDQPDFRLDTALSVCEETSNANNDGKAKATGQVPQYEVRLASDTPDTNPQLATHCARYWNVELPTFDTSTPLQDYFSLVVEAIAQTDQLELEFDIALGSANTPVAAAPLPEAPKLPELPANFDASLAMMITGNKSLQELHAVLNLIGNYNTTGLATDSTNDSAADPLTGSATAEPCIARIHEYSKKLAANGLDNIEFQRLPNLPDNMQRWIDSVRTSLQSDMVNAVLCQPQISARHLIRLAGAIELIDKAPLSMDQYRHPDLCFRATPALLRRARHQARLIEDELASLQSYFVLDKVPAKQQLLSLMEELGGTMNNEPDIVDADYFNARRLFMEFSIEKPNTLTNEHRRLLSQLAKVLRFRELFVNNTEYRLALGPGYRGLRTDWAALEQMGDYAREFSEVLESETLAAHALNDWGRFRSTYINELDVLQQSAEAMRKLLRIVGPVWQTRPANALLAEATEAMERLIQWQEQYGPVGNHAKHTPAAVLAQFTGKSIADVRTETHVGDVQARIKEHLNLGDTTRESLVETLDWLLAASMAATSHQLEISAIVDRLQIA